jgi:hypothetical protein
VGALVAFMALGPSNAQQAKQADNAQGPNPRIVPVVMLKAGEKKELLLATWCRVGATRGGGLMIRAMDQGFQERSKLWKRDGLTVEVPDFGQAEKVAAEPVYAPLRKKGLNAFIVKLSATKDARAGLVDLHVADSTCSGACDTDIRVIVVAP